MEPRFFVVQTRHGIRKDLGEMTQEELLAHLAHLGFGTNRANDFMSELEKNAAFVTFHSADGQFTLDVQRVSTTAAP